MLGRRKNTGRDIPARVYIHRDVLVESARLVRENPSVEVGGKLVGYRIRRGSAAPATPYGEVIAGFWRRAAADEVILVAGSIGSGPRAEASATSLHPDGRFQESVYRKLEAVEPDLEHIGTWHSHHPNRLREFSDGDVRGYAATIADRRYNEDVFIAGLCFEERGLAAGLFDMYTRADPGSPRRLRSGAELQAVESIPSLQRIIAAAEAGLRGGEPAADPLAEAIDKALRDTSGTELVRNADKAGSSWTVSWPRHPERRAVVMHTPGDPTSPAVSITLRTGSAELTLDAVPLSRTAVDLSRDLAETVQSLAKALDQAARRAR
ncbi:hypothetical protein AMIS_51630 [Actinoplanes missouriensis 431]|uniref:JAB domain-containing protein n=1 Tax=Actinoplanes missouriensis (strain ATCC 14538 / DSM 43046 / CBS 188.64 / JCM 3121 / NBRC 102363 / NCIMB 12654 / NRRL B-3342 / UNCC 431) TaxID=512565 RepID=I0HBJ6_ACTM4|nr:hypothetical protein [Actinoplanes missouriensis]BAL90383.1 hypothetical protein AMIS_51630 [Actinoplanes missouriensis 431]